jgi:hypothetical protein
MFAKVGVIWKEGMPGPKLIGCTKYKLLLCRGIFLEIIR